MIAKDILLSRDVDAAQVHAAFAAAFRVAPELVVVAEDGELPSDSPGAMIVELWRKRGEFPLLLSPWPGSAADTEDWENELAQFCALLQCRCLVDDGSAIPGNMLEFGPNGRIRRVAIDSEKEDEGEFSIALILEDDT